MKRILLTLALCLNVNPALALDPPTAIGAGLPESVVADFRNTADYSLVIQTNEWASGPSFVSGKDNWFLHGKIVSVSADKLMASSNKPAPFTAGMDVLVKPYCSRGSKGAPGGPGHGCAEFVNRNIQVWALMADTHAKIIKDKMLIQIENPLDVAFTQ